jgi:hypothetical protein
MGGLDPFSEEFAFAFARRPPPFYNYLNSKHNGRWL